MGLSNWSIRYYGHFKILGALEAPIVGKPESPAHFTGTPNREHRKMFGVEGPRCVCWI